MGIENNKQAKPDIVVQAINKWPFQAVAVIFGLLATAGVTGGVLAAQQKMDNIHAVFKKSGVDDPQTYERVSAIFRRGVGACKELKAEPELEGVCEEAGKIFHTVDPQIAP